MYVCMLNVELLSAMTLAALRSRLPRHMSAEVGERQQVTADGGCRW